MGEAIGDTLPLAIGVALSPVPIIAIVLMLGTPRARSNGPAFALGWIAGLTVVGGVVLALASDNAQADDGSPETWVSVLKLLFGLVFLLLAARTWRGRPRGGVRRRPCPSGCRRSTPSRPGSHSAPASSSPGSTRRTWR